MPQQQRQPEFWSTANQIRPLVSRQRTPTPVDLSVIGPQRSSSSSALAITSPTTTAMNQSMGARAAATTANSSTFLHPSDHVGDPDELVSFSQVKPVRLGPVEGAGGTSRNTTSRRALRTKFGAPRTMLEPIHELSQLVPSRHLNSWPAESPGEHASRNPRAHTAAQQVVATSSLSLANVTSFVEEEMRLVKPTDIQAVLNVYREAFEMIAEEFTTFAPLLRSIRKAYDARLVELEEIVGDRLLGDKDVQQEKEKFLLMQSETMAAFEREKKSVDSLRIRAVDSEEAKSKLESAYTEKLSTFYAELEEVRHHLMMEKTVRMEHQDNLATVSRLMHEARAERDLSKNELEELRKRSTTEVNILKGELHNAQLDVQFMKLRLEQVQVSADKKYKELLDVCVREEEVREMRASVEKVGRNNNVLAKRVKYLEEQLAKATSIAAET